MKKDRFEKYLDERDQPTSTACCAWAAATS